MRRREFITLVGGAAATWPIVAASAQQSALIGFLNAGAAIDLKREIDAFRDGLRNLDRSEGHNVRFEYRFAESYLDRLPTLAAELVRLNPNVIVSSPVPANLAIAKATSTIPIVMASGADPVGFGLVKSLSHPGGNITGLTNFAEELASKQIDLMRELLPGLARLAALVNVANPLHVPQWRETQAAAAQAARARAVRISQPRSIGGGLCEVRTRAGRRAACSARRDLHHPSAAHRKSRARRAATDDLFPPSIRRGRRPDELRHQSG